MRGWLGWWGIAGCIGLLALGCPAEEADDDTTGDDDATGDDDDTTGDDDTTPLDDDDDEPDSGGPGFFNEIGLADDGTIHIVHYWITWPGNDSENATGRFEHVFGGWGDWDDEELDTHGFWGADTGLQIDDAGALHISYFYWGEPAYLTDASGSWQRHEFDGEVEDASGATALALDGDGHPQLSYYDSVDLHLATDPGDGWSEQTVADVGWNGGDHGMDLDADGGAHILVHDRQRELMRYFTDASGAWSETEIGQTTSGDAEPDLRIAGDGTIHGAWADDDNTQIRHGWTLPPQGWSEEIVESGSSFETPDMALGGDGAVHLCYREAGEGELRYATNITGAWVAELVDDTVDTGRYCAIAVDDDGFAHIAYQTREPNSNTTELLYARNTPGYWVRDGIAVASTPE
jgi:hypothetical protein